MTAGRPSKYDPAYCDEVIEAGKLGYSLTAFAADCGVARSTINEWIGEHPDFREAVGIHKAHRTHFLESRLLAMTAAGGGPGQVTAIIFGLKNIAPDEWRDKREVEHSGAVEQKHSTDTEIAKALMSVLSRAVADEQSP